MEMLILIMMTFFFPPEIRLAHGKRLVCASGDSAKEKYEHLIVCAVKEYSYTKCAMVHS